MKEKYNPIYTITALIMLTVISWGASEYYETSFWTIFIIALISIIVNIFVMNHEDKLEYGETSIFRCEECNKEYESYSEITCAFCKNKLCDDHFSEYRMHHYSWTICNDCYKQKEFEKLMNHKRNED